MNAEALPVAKFRLGNIVTAPNAKEKLTFEDIAAAIRRHQAGEWGEVADTDRTENNLALQHGRALRSVYRSAKGAKFSLVTEADRSFTTLSLTDVNRPRAVYRLGSSVSIASDPLLSVATASPILTTEKSEVSEQPKSSPENGVRSLQIEEIGDRWKGFKPRIRMMGKWLERAGFKPGTRVSVICRDSGLIELRACSPVVQTDSDKAVELLQTSSNPA